MKIVAGLGTLDEYDAYCEAGADELFLGVMPLDWLEKWGVTVPLNRREVLLSPAQIASFSDMRILARLSRNDRVPVAVTFNSTSYGPAHYPVIAGMMEELTDMGIDRFILADPALMLRAPKGSKIHVSGEWGEYSRASMDFLRPFHPARLIFHRKVAPEEMRLCAGALPNLEYEAFILNERCHYTGSMCNCLHCDEMPPLCRLPWKAGGVSERLSFGKNRERETDPGIFGSTGCGLCALDDLRAAGITHLKLVGRGNRPEYMVRDIRALRKVLSGEPNWRESLFPQGCGEACYYENANREGHVSW